MKKKLSLLMTLLLCAVMGAWADYYTPTQDEEVIYLKDVYSADATDAGYSTHSAVAWGGTASANSKKTGDPDNGGEATSSNVACFSVKGNGGGKNITISVTGVSKITVYHESHNERYLQLRSESKSGAIIGQGAAGTYYTEVDLDGSTKYNIFLHGTKTGSDDQDLNVYAVKLEKAAEATEKTIYLKPGVWAQDNARFAVNAFNDTENTWIDFEAVEGDEGVYNATVPVSYTTIILVRMNPETTENNWANKWNQTADITFADIADNAQFTFTDWDNYEVGTYTAPVEYTVTFATDAEWEEVYAYAYTGDTPVTAWPGENITESLTDGVYTYTFKATSAPEKIIFGDGTQDGSVEGVNQTAAMDFVNGKAYEYKKQNFTVTFKTDAEWENVYAYAYTDDTPVKAWPGENITATLTDGVYTYTFTAFNAPEKIIFGDGTQVGSVEGVNQTAAMDFVNGKDYKFFTTWTVAGSSTVLFGGSVEWDATNEANDMVFDEVTSLYTWTASKVKLTAGDVAFKVVKNHAWAEDYPDNDNYVINISEAGWYDVVITFNADTKDINATATKMVLDEQANVTGDATWDWSNFGGSDIELSGTTAPTNTDEFVLSNAVKFGLCESIGEEFGNAQQLAVVTQYVTRTQSNKHFMQGNVVKFNTTVPGTVKVWFSNTGSRNNEDALKRFLYINETNTGVFSLDTEMKDASLHVNAGEVIINAYMGVEDPVATMVRISKIQFVADEPLVISSMTIVGDFLGLETEEENFNPANGWPMTQDGVNHAIWTLTKEGIEVEGKQYRYKATANDKYGDYELPAEGNQDFLFGTEGYPAGKYNLTFTADTENHTLTLDVTPWTGSVDIVITSARYATFSNANAVAIPEGVTAYYAQKNEKKENTINLKPIEGGCIPANTGVVVVAGAAGTYKADITSTVATLDGNLLKPWLTAGEPTDEVYYTLAEEEGKPVFKLSTGGTLAAGKAYLVLPAETGAHTLDVVFGDATGIGAALNDNGEMTNDKPVYNLAGQRVSKPTKGLYIVGGKKVALR